MTAIIKRWIGAFANWYFDKKSLPYWIIVFIDAAIVFSCMLLTFYCFWGGSNEPIEDIVVSSIFYSLIYVIFFRVFRTYSGILRYSSFVDLLQIVKAVTCGMVVALIVLFTIHYLHLGWPMHLRGRVIVTASIFAGMLMALVRMIVKNIYDVEFATKNAQSCFIYGVQNVGIGIAKSIRNEKPAKFVLKGFVTDVADMGDYIIMGKKVHYMDDELVPTMKAMHISALIVSPLRATAFRNNTKLQDQLIDAGIKIYMHEGEQEFNDDDKETVTLKEVSVEDLLPRNEIKISLDNVAKMLKDEVVLITGAAGSIGSEIVRQVAQFAPKQLVLIDQAETPEHDIRLMMKNEYPNIPAETIVCTIVDAERMRNIFKHYKPAYVFHAAAYKHVPMMEDNPSEAVHNNIWGTKVIADISVEFGVKKFVMISTDKAVNPTNVMGCSKRICEIYVQSLNNSLKGKEGATQFVTTRFGNVLGSNGSVIPLFREQIKNGGPVTVTDPNIIRFFMLIPEACKLVLEAGTMGNGGEIFVFDMGKPVKIADLAKRMIAMSGAKNVEIKYTGLREGEKLYEEVLSEEENTKPSFHEKIRIAEVREYEYTQVCTDLDELFSISIRYDDMATVKKMKDIVPEYKSNNSKYSILDK